MELIKEHQRAATGGSSKDISKKTSGGSVGADDEFFDVIETFDDISIGGESKSDAGSGIVEIKATTDTPAKVTA